MTGNRSVFHFRRSFANGDGIDNSILRVPVNAGVSRAAHASLRPQVIHQLLFQRSPRLNEQAAVNGFVGHVHALVIGILNFQPSGNLFGRPVQDQFTRNDVPQLVVDGKEALLRSQGWVPGTVIRPMGSISWTATVAAYFTANRRSCSIQSPSNLTKRRTGRDSSRYIFSLSQGEREARALTGCWRNPSARQ
jgi:hypothetical protein